MVRLGIDSTETGQAGSPTNTSRRSFRCLIFILSILDINLAEYSVISTHAIYTLIFPRQIKMLTITKNYFVPWYKWINDIRLGSKRVKKSKSQKSRILSIFTWKGLNFRCKPIFWHWKKLSDLPEFFNSCIVFSISKTLEP